MVVGRIGISCAGVVLLLLALPEQALACGCCYQQFSPWPMYHHTMYESPGGNDCPGGFPRTVEPHGAHGNLLPGSCDNGTYHNHCGVTFHSAIESHFAGDIETLIQTVMHHPGLRLGHGGPELLTCQGESHAWAPARTPDAPFRSVDLIIGPEDA